MTYKIFYYKSHRYNHLRVWCSIELLGIHSNTWNHQLRGAFNKYPDFFVQAFKIVLDSWKFSILLLYILWDDGPIFMISASNKQLQ